jgi:hypothetical protein
MDELQDAWTVLLKQRIEPEYYKSPDGLQAIDAIEAFDLNFNLGNVVKYIVRAGKKHNRQADLIKALWYLQREIGD